jgi:NAD(P)-dependent dehydrogenase (short-subunit alcohol dehydrogenase family)
MDEESLKGKVALVTGGGGGIGEAVCKKLASLGVFVYVNDVSEQGKRVTEEINELSKSEKASFVQYDISSRTAVEEMFKKIEDERRRINILVNNAAIYGPSCKFHEMPYEDFVKTIGVDLSGAVYCTLLALSHMYQNEWGRIIFTAAPMSSSGIPAPYLAGKAGFIGLSKYISKEFNRENINTFGLALRHVGTPMIKRVIKSRGKNVETGLEELNKKSLTGRMIAPEEIAEIYAYFLTSFYEPLAGVVMLADGGITYLR